MIGTFVSRGDLTWGALPSGPTISFSYCEIRLGKEKRSGSDISRGFCSLSVFYYELSYGFSADGSGKALANPRFVPWRSCKVLFSFGSFASLLFLIGWSARVTGIFDGVLFG